MNFTNFEIPKYFMWDKCIFVPAKAESKGIACPLQGEIYYNFNTTPYRTRPRETKLQILLIAKDLCFI